MFPKGTPVEVAASTHAICFGLPNSDPYYLCHFLILVGFHDTSAPLSPVLHNSVTQAILTKPKVSPWEVAPRLPALPQQ